MIQNWEIEFPNLTEEDIREFALTSHEPNLIHRDSAAARRRGLLGIVALNTMVDNYASSTIARYLPGVRVVKKTVEYKNPLYAGFSPRVTCTVVWKKMHLADVRFVIRNGYETTIAEGMCRILLPPELRQTVQAIKESAVA